MTDAHMTDAHMTDTQTSHTESPPNPLSEREMDVARLLAQGMSNAEIARDLVLSPHTVKVHLRNIYTKLEVNSRTEASMVLVQQGWLIVPGAEIAETVAPVPPAPDPLPLSPLPPRIAPWQRLYLVMAAAICALALGLPALFTATASQSPDLLSDTDRLVVGRPALESLARWEVRTPLPQARDRLGLVLVGNALFALGGESAQGMPVDSVDVYDLAVNDWSQADPLPVPLANMGVAVLDEGIYVAGGSSNLPAVDTILDDLWVYAQDGLGWQSAGVLPMPLAGASLVSLDGALYLVGGWDGTAMRDEVWVWTPSDSPAQAADWAVVARMASPRAFLGSVGVRVSEVSTLYVVGGYDGERELDDAAALDVTSGTWQDLPDLSVARAGHSLVFDGGGVVALGGGWTQSINTHERFDPAIGLWSNFPSPLTGEWRHLAAAPKDGNIHLVGGWSGDYLDLHMQYQSRFLNFLPINVQGN